MASYPITLIHGKQDLNEALTLDDEVILKAAESKEIDLRCSCRGGLAARESARSTEAASISGTKHPG